MELASRSAAQVSVGVPFARDKENHSFWQGRAVSHIPKERWLLSDWQNVGIWSVLQTWYLNLSMLKSNRVKFQFLSCTGHILSVRKPCVARGNKTSLHHSREFHRTPPSQRAVCERLCLWSESRGFSMQSGKLLLQSLATPVNSMNALRV